MGSWAIVTQMVWGLVIPEDAWSNKEQDLLSEMTLKCGPDNFFKCYSLFCTKEVGVGVVGKSLDCFALMKSHCTVILDQHMSISSQQVSQAFSHFSWGIL